MALKPWSQLKPVARYEIITFTVVFSLILIFLPVAAILFVQGGAKTTYQGLKPVPADGLFVQVDITAIDTIGYMFKAYVSFKPFGKYAAKDSGAFDDLSQKSSLVPNTNINVMINAEQLELPANVPVSAQSLSYLFSEGDTFFYPFDLRMLNLLFVGSYY
jgi:hypothetical protein